MKQNKWPDIKTTLALVFDFDGVFTDNKVYVDTNGNETVRCNRADGLAIDILRKFKERQLLAASFFILSSEKNPIVAARASKMRIDCHHGVWNKLQFLDQHLQEHYPGQADPFANIVYLGNDLNDLPVINKVGFSVVPNDAHPMVKSVASVTLPQNGGEGFVRAFVEKFLGIESLTAEEINELIFNS